MKKLILTLFCIAMAGMCMADTLSLDSCRSLALKNNKNIKMADEAVKGAGYVRKSAFAAYLPGIDFTAAICTTSISLNCWERTRSCPP